MLRKLLTTHPALLLGTEAAKTDTGQRVAWSAVSTLSGLAAAMATKKALSMAWSGATNGEPPQNPADPATNWTEAIGWAVSIGVGAGVARVVARRAAAKGWEQVVGSPPPTRSRDTDDA